MTKKLHRFLLCYLIFFLFLVPTTVYGETNQSQDSEGTVSFVGEWTGEVPDPKPPVGEKNTTHNKNRLPQTGESETYGVKIGVAMILFVICSIVIRFIKNKEKEGKQS